MSRRRPMGSMPDVPELAYDRVQPEPRHRHRPARSRPPTVSDLGRRLGVTSERARDYLTGERTPAGWVQREVEEWRERGGVAPEERQ